MTKADRTALKTDNIVMVIWEDITEQINDTFKTTTTAECESFGRVVSIIKKGGIEQLILASSKYTEKDFKGTGTSSAIPIGCISRVVKLG